MLVAPQLVQVHVWGAAGRGVPHSEQNLPVLVAPQLVQIQLLALWLVAVVDGAAPEVSAGAVALKPPFAEV